MRLFGLVPAFFAVSSLALAQVRAEQPGDGDWKGRLESAIRRALSSNPDLRATSARADALRHRVAQADVLPDPEIEVGVKDAPPSDFSLSRDDFTMETVSARQRFPAAGKRGALRASAEAQLAHAVAIRGRDAVRLAADVADAFFQLAETDRRIAISDEARSRFREAAQSATERYRVGKGAQTDVLRANLETTALEERLLSLTSERRGQAARFNALQGAPAGDPVAMLGSVDPGKDSRSPEELLRQSLERSPNVRAAAAELTRAEAERELAILERRPDLTAMGYYAHRVRFEDLVGGTIAFNLPFAHPRRLLERRAEAESQISAARADLEAARNMIRQGVEEALSDLQKNVDQAHLYRTSILPQAELNFRAAREAYVVGQVDFETFARAATNLDDYRSEAAARAARIGRSLAVLQKASGLALIHGTPDGEGDQR